MADNNQPPAEAAHRLRTASLSGVACPPVRSLLGEGQAAIDKAYEAQRINLTAHLEQDARIVGRKIGLTSKAVQAQLGVDQPDFGTLLDSMAFADGETVPASSVMQPRAEAEIALVMAKDLEIARPTLADLIGAVAYVLPVIEVADSRIAGWDITIADTVADNASAGVFILGGSPKLLTGIDLAKVAMRMTRDGETVSTGIGSNCLSHPLSAALWLARKLTFLGQSLRAGDVVLTGALGPMVQARAGDRFCAEIEGLGSVSFAMEPAR